MEMDLDRRGEDDKMGADSLTDEEVRRSDRGGVTTSVSVVTAPATAYNPE